MSASLPSSLDLSIVAMPSSPVIPTTEENKALYNQLQEMIIKINEIIDGAGDIVDTVNDLIDYASDLNDRVTALENA